MIVSRVVDLDVDPDIVCGAKFEKCYLFNEKLVHLVDDIFWHLGFKSSEHAEQVISS